MFTLAGEEFLIDLVKSDNFIPIIAITLGCMTGMVGIICGMVGTIVRTRARETSRRELAAYVAEGSIKPDEAVAIMNAGRPRWEMPDGSGVKARKA